MNVCDGVCMTVCERQRRQQERKSERESEGGIEGESRRERGGRGAVSERVTDKDKGTERESG